MPTHNGFTIAKRLQRYLISVIENEELTHAQRFKAAQELAHLKAISVKPAKEQSKPRQSLGTMPNEG